MKQADLAATLGKALGEQMTALLLPLVERVRKVEATVAELQRGIEQRSYRGTWDGAATYDAHNLVTLSGSVWIAKRPTTDRPGTSDAWQLAVRKGRDARDR